MTGQGVWFLVTKFRVAK